MPKPPSMTLRLILASSSPRRQSLLREAGYAPLVHPSHLDEQLYEKPGIAPAELAMVLARAKAQAVAEEFPNDIVLAADTVVALGNQCIGKAADAADARRILNLLSGTMHQVITGVVVVHLAAAHLQEQCVTSGVRMRALTPQQIDAYIATNQWQGKAGAYGIQDDDPFVERLEGCLTNIVGLPMTTTRAMLEKAGIARGRHEGAE